MNTTDIERIYTVLAQCIARVGKDKAPVMLATLALDLLHRLPDAAAALEHIERAERLAER
jgi:hypothetical protein